MDINELRSFLAVAEEGSFSRAAQELHLSQPAVSKRVAALEADLETRLFDRIGHAVRLTEAGRMLLPRARAVLQALENTRQALGDLSGRVAGPLAMATSHHVGLHRLPPVLRAFTTRWPEVELDLRFMASEQAAQAVRRGERELAVVTLPAEPPAALECRAIWPDPLRIVVGREHPLSAAGEVTPRELVAHPAVLPSVGTHTRTLVEDAFRAAGAAISVRLETDYLETIKMLVSVGLGWSVLPQTLLGPELTPLPVRDIRLSRTLGVIRHRQHTFSNAARAMLELLTEAGASTDC